MTPSLEAELRAICPFCGSLTQSGRIDGKFYVNLSTGLYYCFHCQVKGKNLTDEQLENLEVIDEIVKKPFNNSCLAKLLPDAPQRTAFLEERFPGINFDGGIGRAHVFYSPEQQAIALVVKNHLGETMGVKYRKLDPSVSPRYLSETGSVNEGFWLTGSDKDKLLIVEGEIDALTAVYAGFTGSVLACQTNRIPESALNAIKGYKNVFVLPDNDLGGVELENSTTRLLGSLNPIVIKITDPVIKDLNELLQRRDYEQCREFIKLETRTQLERDTKVLSDSLPELVSWLSDNRNTVGQTTGWNSIDALLGGGLRAGEMSVINAFAKSGKSSFINNLIHSLAKAGKKIALASFEMDPARVIYPTLLTIASAVNIRSIPADQLKESVELLSEEYKYLNNIITLKRFGYTPWKEIEEWAVYMKKAYDIEYLVLDHAGFMVEKMTDAEENQILAKNIKRLTNTLGIHIPVVVQAPKTKDGLSIQTSYGGLAWGMNADNFLILERDSKDELLLKVRLEAARYPGARPGPEAVHLFYDRDSYRLTE